jgi:hypothetical protein
VFFFENDAHLAGIGAAVDAKQFHVIPPVARFYIAAGDTCRTAAEWRLLQGRP